MDRQSNENRTPRVTRARQHKMTGRAGEKQGLDNHKIKRVFQDYTKGLCFNKERINKIIEMNKSKSNC